MRKREGSIYDIYQFSLPPDDPLYQKYFEVDNAAGRYLQELQNAGKTISWKIPQRKNMKIEINRIDFILIVCLFAALILPGLSATKEAKSAALGGHIVEGFQLAAHVTKSTFAPVEPIITSITLKNTTDKTLQYLQSYPKYDYSITVYDSNGNFVPLTHYGNRLKTEVKTFFGIGTAELQKGEEVKYTFLVNRLFDMTEAGEYSIIIRCSIPKQDKSGFLPLVSNTIQVKIVESK